MVDQLRLVDNRLTCRRQRSRPWQIAIGIRLEDGAVVELGRTALGLTTARDPVAHRPGQHPIPLGEDTTASEWPKQARPAQINWRGTDAYHPAQDSSCLVLPSATCRIGLYQDQGPGLQPASRRASSARLGPRSPHCLRPVYRAAKGFRHPSVRLARD
jgi:hypothetical protein